MNNPKREINNTTKNKIEKGSDSDIISYKSEQSILYQLALCLFAVIDSSTNENVLCVTLASLLKLWVFAANHRARLA
jgi:hypothetical protein